MFSLLKKLGIQVVLEVNKISLKEIIKERKYLNITLKKFAMKYILINEILSLEFFN